MKAPSFGYNVTQKTTYLDYKVHAIITVNCVVTHFDLSKANMADIHYLEGIKEYYPGAFRGYGLFKCPITDGIV